MQNKLLLTITLLLAAGLCDLAANPSARMLPDQTETPRMKQWMDYHYGLFLCFNNNTFIGEHVPVPPPATTYAPKALDVDSWLCLAKDAGMKYAVLTTKHDGGFCLWDSKVMWHGKEFTYDVATSGNTTDVVRAFMDACKKYDIAPGFYYCLADTYANKSESDLRKLFRKGVMPEDAFELAKAQLAELATNYPECHYYWLDIPQTATVNQQAALYDLLRRKHPANVVLMNQHLAGPKTKSDRGAETGEQTLVEKEKAVAYPVDVLNTEAWQRPKGVVSNIQRWQGKQLFMGYEHCDIAGSGWFNTTQPKSAAAIFQVYKTIRQAGGNFLLSVGPSPAGTMRPEFRALLLQLRKQIEAFEKSMAEKPVPDTDKRSQK